jgi:hypothetical protein
MKLRLKDRILVMLQSFFLCVLGLFFTGSFLWFILLLIPLTYVIIGGKKHV